MRDLIESLDSLMTVDLSEEDQILDAMAAAGIDSLEDLAELDESSLVELGLSEGIISALKSKIGASRAKARKRLAQKVDTSSKEAEARGRSATHMGLNTKAGSREAAKGYKAFKRAQKSAAKLDKKRSARREKLLGAVRRGEHKRHLKAKETEPASQPIEVRRRAARIKLKARELSKSVKPGDSKPSQRPSQRKGTNFQRPAKDGPDSEKTVVEKTPVSKKKGKPYSSFKAAQQAVKSNAQKRRDSTKVADRGQLKAQSQGLAAQKNIKRKARPR